jgi:hypothetical protein
MPLGIVASLPSALLDNKHVLFPQFQNILAPVFAEQMFAQR